MRLLAPLFVIGCITTARADEWDGPDKRVHFIVGIDVGAGASLFAHGLPLDRAERALFGWAVATAAGAAKEGADALGLGAASFQDFAWTSLGGLVGIGLVYLFESL